MSDYMSNQSNQQILSFGLSRPKGDQTGRARDGHLELGMSTNMASQSIIDLVILGKRRQKTDMLVFPLS